MAQYDYSAIVNGFIHTLWKTDGAELGRYITDDYFSHESPDATPGPQGEIEVASVWKTAFEDFNYRIDLIVGDGDRVATVGTISGTHTGDYLGKNGTGRRFEVRTCDFLTLRDGKISEHRGIYEDSRMNEQLGL